MIVGVQTNHFGSPKDRKSTRLNSSHTVISYAVCCLKKKMKTVTARLERFKSDKAGPEEPVLKPTGQKEVVNGYETEQYTYDGPNFKATYRVAPNYPNGAAILAQLQSVKSEFWDAANTKMP